MPNRIQRRRTKGWRMPQGVVYVGRPSRWGNPFTVGDQHFEGERFFEIYGHLMQPERWQDRAVGRVTAENLLALFRLYCEKRGQEWLEKLRGKDLACWCKEDAPCHADILLELANA